MHFANNLRAGACRLATASTPALACLKALNPCSCEAPREVLTAVAQTCRATTDTTHAKSFVNCMVSRRSVAWLPHDAADGNFGNTNSPSKTCAAQSLVKPAYSRRFARTGVVPDGFEIHPSACLKSLKLVYTLLRVKRSLRRPTGKVKSIENR